MIISRKYRYLFIELPLTASTAVAAELQANYEGEEILYKHANYRRFLKIAKAEEKGYFTFIGVRNPLDQAVSHYFKYLNDHKGRFSSPQPRRTGRFKHWNEHRGHQAKYRFIKKTDAGFGEFFLKFYDRPYMDWSLLDADRMDGLIRFEHIQEDFEAILDKLGLPLMRPLPQINRTKDKESSFWEHYDTPELRQRAARVFGPYMSVWNYSFPSEWNVAEFTALDQKKFERELGLKKVYWAMIG